MSAALWHCRQNVVATIKAFFTFSEILHVELFIRKVSLRKVVVTSLGGKSLNRIQAF
jgi:hypothetical protein